MQDLFKSSVFRVPDYQRGYAWKTQNVDDLLEDLETLEVGAKHYTGTLVLKKGEELQGLGHVIKQYDLVDGQQRLTTLVILLKNIVRIMESKKKSEEDDIVIKNLTQSYLWEKGKGGEIFKLKLEKENDLFFVNSILNGRDMKELNLSHGNLVSADKRIHNYLIKKASDGTFLDNLVNKITNSLMFTVYVITDDYEVGVIFETMNDRGIQLSELEKVKNFLLYLTGRVAGAGEPRGDTSNYINTSWSHILRNLYLPGNKNMSEDQLLRVSAILMFYDELESIRENGKVIESVNTQLGSQYRLIKKHLTELLKLDKEKCHEEIREVVNHLEKLSEKYRDIKVPEDPNSFSDITDKVLKDRIKNACIRYDRMGSLASFLPLLLAIYYKYSSQPDVMADLFELMEKGIFIIYGLSDRRSNAAESTLYTMAYEVYNDKLRSDGVSSQVRNLVKDYSDEFRKALQEDKGFYEWGWLKYFLYEYEIWRCKKINKGSPSFTWQQLKRKDLEETVEHILPKTYPERVPYWTSRFSREDHKRNLDRIGNLTLTDQNLYLSNKPFDDKKELYKNSSWQIERDLINFKEWNEESINKREEELVKFAQDRWKI
ncbi:MAG: DUF262 domain-containing HNH endonuclease family protein [Candidatus Thermoplasmatota archaeon]|nr:DUF262 domain-containing HNH endonuclease family protein [Candidatus Thermoplasmatota archaeon]